MLSHTDIYTKGNKSSLRGVVTSNISLPNGWLTKYVPCASTGKSMVLTTFSKCNVFRQKYCKKCDTYRDVCRNFKNFQYVETDEVSGEKKYKNTKLRILIDVDCSQIEQKILLC